MATKTKKTETKKTETPADLIQRATDSVWDLGGIPHRKLPGELDPIRPLRRAFEDEEYGRLIAYVAILEVIAADALPRDIEARRERIDELVAKYAEPRRR